MSMNTLSWSPIPEDVKDWLKLAADHWDNPTESIQYVHQALKHSGDCMDVLIAAYRYFFYRSQYELALQMASTICDRIRVAEQLPQEWAQLEPVLAKRKEEEVIRLYLNAWAASGFTLARLGRFDQAKDITAKVSAIDSKEFGGSAVVFDVLTRPPEEDD